METAQHWDRLAKDQPAEITMFQISEVQESPAFNGRRSSLTLRGAGHSSSPQRDCAKIDQKKYWAAISGCNSHPPSELRLISAMLSIGLTTTTGFKIPEFYQIHNLGAFSRVLGACDCAKRDFQKDAGPAKGLADCTIWRDAMTGSLPSISHRKPKCFLGVRFLFTCTVGWKEQKPDERLQKQRQFQCLPRDRPGCPLSRR